MLALRGDPQEGPRAEWTPTEGGFTYASELVELAAGTVLRRRRRPPRRPPRLGLPRPRRRGAARASRRAGAEFAITDMVFRVSDYVELVERAAAVGVTIPILPGIMPILNLGQVTRMGELSGHPVPDEVVERVKVHEGDPAALRAEGIAMAAELCEALLAAGAPGATHVMERGTRRRGLSPPAAWARCGA